jgi:indole-3-glycerol phosphate synthase
MSDFLDVIIRDVKKTIEHDFYKGEEGEHEGKSLKGAIMECERNPLIAEVKQASPSRGIIRKEINLTSLTASIQRGGAVGISILTEPQHFQGSLNRFKAIRRLTTIPLLMKDFIISPIQVHAAANVGADAVLLIQTLFDRGYSHLDRDEMIDLIHTYKMEVLLETHTEEEFYRATTSPADLLGINNRNLATLDVDLHITEKILLKHNEPGKVIVSESGIECPAHIRFLRRAGAHAFLVGTVLMSTKNIEEKTRELVEA